MTGRLLASAGGRRWLGWARTAAALWLAATVSACVTFPTATPPATPVSESTPVTGGVTQPPPSATPAPVSVATPAALPSLTPTRTPVSTPSPLPVLRVGVDAASRPWCYRNAAGDLAGLDVDLLAALADQMGVRLEYVNTAPHLLLPGLAAGRYDLAAAGLVVTPERQAEAWLSEPYFTLSQAVIVRATDTLTGSAALAGKEVGVQIGSPAVAEARRLGATVHLYDDLVIALGALARGEAAAVIGDDLGAADYSADHPEARLRRVGVGLAPAPVALAVAKDQPALLSRVNAGLAALRRSGALEALAQKWLR